MLYHRGKYQEMSCVNKQVHDQNYFNQTKRTYMAMYEENILRCVMIICPMHVLAKGVYDCWFL